MAAFKEIQEGKAIIQIARETKITSKLPVFYNPVMKSNRDLSLLVLKALGMKDLRIGLPLAGTGIRGIRMLQELPASMIESISFNDHDDISIKNIKKNLKLNKIAKKIEISKKDANQFLLESTGFDYIDIDPFGSPNPYLDSAMRRLSRRGILAITATDTAPLCGTYPKACKRKYWAVPLKNEFMHETGLRILIRKVQLIAAQYDKALMPIFSFSKDHYFRVIFRCEKGKEAVDEVIKLHSLATYNTKTLDRKTGIEFGPVYTGPLFDKELVKKMTKEKEQYGHEKFMEIIKKESTINSPFHYDIHKITSKYKLKRPIAMKELFAILKKNKMKAAPTHFSPTGFVCDADIKAIVKVLK